MKINEKQTITGMYLYNENYEYTVDDFVVYDGVIYICIKDSKNNIPPNSPEHFTIYLGDKGRAIDFQGYLDFLEKTENLPLYQKYLEENYDEAIEFINNSEGDNKYLSVGMLQAVMSCFLLGPTGKGIIGDYICYDSEGLRVSKRLGEIDGRFTDPETIISQIMYHPNINHAILRVSRLLPEINGYVGGIQNVSDFSGLDDKSVILRQYTYLQEETGDKIRLQELIDPIDGVIWYRSGNMDSNINISTGTWKCSIGNSRTLKSKVEDIISVYTSRLKIIKSLETQLKSNFRFKKLDFGVRSTSFEYTGEVENPEITITVSEMTHEGYIRNYQTTINLNEGDIYLVGEKYRIQIMPGNVIKLINETSNNAWFSGAYYKEYYGLS